jgi:uncharacterized protein YyaL (SSP411 family)
MNTSKPANKLISSASPYLLQHAYNPVHWQEWNADSLAEAKEYNKPIIVSIGYSACHWCHVMERECFENEAIAEIMNKHFICIKIDREERPDIDAIYMEAVQAMGINGGWPLNVFLMPNLKPFYGGTYFPPTKWTALLENIANAFVEHEHELLQSADEFAAHINRSEIERFRLKEGLESNPKSDSVEKHYAQLSKAFDTTWGGLQRAPKFPLPSIWIWLAQYAHTFKDADALQHLTLTLDKMSMGGLYDCVVGGFSRYSVDGEWFAPHFEKMLYDNGQLLTLYSEAYALTKKSDYKVVINQTIEWLSEELLHPKGGFYSALDADSEGIEGKFYTYTYSELKAILGSGFLDFCTIYNTKEEGNWEHEVNILFRTSSWELLAVQLGYDNKEELLTANNGWMQILKQYRAERIRPGLDDKILVSWNALTISGLASAYKATGNSQALSLAEKSLDFILDNCLDGSELFHAWKNDKPYQTAFLDDYATVIQALINLYQCNFNEGYLYTAEALTNYVIENFYDQAEGFFYFAQANKELIARKKEIFDNVIPASNSIMAHNLYWLGLLLEKESFTEISTSMVGKVTNALQADISFMSNWAQLYQAMATTTVEIAIIGENAMDLVKEFDKHYIPNKVVCASTSSSNLPLLAQRYVENQTLIYVCYNKTCQKPVHTVAEALADINNLINQR